MPEFRFHSAPEVEPFEYFCKICKSLNLSMVALEFCPVCKTLITIRGGINELNKEQLLKEANA